MNLSDVAIFVVVFIAAIGFVAGIAALILLTAQVRKVRR